MSYFSQVEYHANSRDQLKQLHKMRSQPYHQHQALWTLFDQQTAAQQPFVFRDMSQVDGSSLRFLMVSTKAPRTADDSWQVRSKPFSPQIAVGDLLTFRLRMNPTRTVKPEAADKDARGKRHDWVMSMLHALPAAQRAGQRQRLIYEELPKWFSERSERFGFATKKVQVQSYENLEMQAKGMPIRLGAAEFDGVLEVQDVALMQTSLTKGIGHGKSFGLGLLMVKR